jgi:hypothetical protein
VRVWAGAIGGTVLGAALGWFLPALFVEHALAALAAQALGLGVGATLGLILGGGLAARAVDRRAPPPDNAERRDA